MEKILSLENIKKTYPGVTALDNVSIDFYPGQVHAIVGENGAGKSTMIKIISGAEIPDSGLICFEGKSYDKMQPSLSLGLGIEVVYQEINLVSTLDAAENIFLGNPVLKGIILDRKTLRGKTLKLFDQMNISIDPSSKMKDLTIPQQQLVEIAKAVSKATKVLILDEPTATLTDQEITILFDLIQKLKQQGVSIIYISHRLEELFQITDTITVMRDGRKIIHLKTSETNREQLISHMVGKDLIENFPQRNVSLGDVQLEVSGLNGNGIKDASFSVRSGEIVGLAGLVGAGRSELVRLIFGADPLDSGEIFIAGRKVQIKNPIDAVKAGMGLIPEDRKREGILLNLSVKWNIALPIIKQLSKKFMIVDNSKVNTLYEDYRKKLQIKTPSMNQAVKNLSGGNQQKIVLSKWLASNPRIIIFDEPTRGIDVGAKQDIYRIISAMAEEGYAIILISSELNEVIGLSDRILVIADGKIVSTLEKHEFEQDRILNFAFTH